MLKANGLRIIVYICLMCGAAGSAEGTVSFSPKSVNFGQVTVGVPVGTLVSITNTGTSPITITSVTISPSPVFYVGEGVTPFVLGRGSIGNYSIRFAPTAAQTYSGQFQAFLSDGTNFTVPISGTGVITNAVSQISPASVNFGNQLQGTTSTAQQITILNTGSSSFTVTAIRTFAPFIVSGLAVPSTVQPGRSVTAQVSFFSNALGAATGTLTIFYDVLPPGGVTLSGRATAQSSLASTTFPTLPSATRGFAYFAPLGAVGGTPPYIWSVAKGTTLPLGLTLSGSGAIGGTVAPSLPVKSYALHLQLTDSSSPMNVVAVPLTLVVGAPTGASCGNISVNVTGTTNPVIPMTDLGTGTYLGVQGGLYAGGSNTRPTGHSTYGVNLANSIHPLDEDGNPDPNGKYVLLSIGESDTEQEFAQFFTNVTADPSTSPHLVIVNGGQPDETSDRLADPNNGFWNQIIGSLLPASYVTPQQVVAVWLQSIHAKPKGNFPTHVAQLQGELESVVQNLHKKFPNLVLTYMSSRYYGGYSNGIVTTDPEPYSYEQGFAIKNLIQQQLNGDPNLNFAPVNGTVMAPWLSWGPYNWANGLLPRSDGLVWDCQDLKFDGIHPETPGRERASTLLTNFFRTDPTTTSWFLAH
jgi:hypothetical protein